MLPHCRQVGVTHCTCISLALALSVGSARASPCALQLAIHDTALLRPADPVILSGASAPSLLGALPGSVVAYRFESSWIQIPVQIDERDYVDFGRIYDASPVNVTALVYTDAATWTGPDSDPMVDSNDEIVLMAHDAGGRVPVGLSSEPPGTVVNSGIEIRITDSLRTGAVGFVYLFRTPVAAQQPTAYVLYTFQLLSGAYRATYNLMNGPNPEDSTVVTSYYREHFSDRWIQDELELGDSVSAPDLLDRDKVLFAPGTCDRSENTFCGYDVPGGAASRGAFIANKAGPVRAIRSILGANSGIITQRDLFLYDRRQDVVTTVRVHPIPGCMSFFDFSPAATGMTYSVKSRNGRIQTAPVDGHPDAIIEGMTEWEMLSGSPGTIIRAWDVDTDIVGLDVASYYLDDDTPSTVQCTGDHASFASSGAWIRPGQNVSIPCTDPIRVAHTETCPILSHLKVILRVVYEKPGIPVSQNDAQRLRDSAITELGVSTTSWPNAGAGPVGDSPGVYVRETGFWFLRNVNESGNADTVFGYGAESSGLVPIKGDWDGNGTDTPGIFDPSTSGFFLRNSSSSGPGDLVFQFGAGGLGAVPLAGDWNGDGVDSVGLYLPATGTFFLKNEDAPGPADVVFEFGAGGAGTSPIAGDWNNDGTDTIGLYVSSTATFFLTDANMPGPANSAFTFGASGGVPVTGDRDGDGMDSIGIYDSPSGAWFLTNTNASGTADLVFTFAAPGLIPIAGNWDGQ